MAVSSAPVIRRRQRSVRVTASVSSLAGATVIVLGALPTESALVLGAAVFVAMALAWAALRMMWTEVLQARRDNANDRAAAAAAYRALDSARVAEHVVFVTAMTERLAEAHLSGRELEGRCEQSERALGASRRRVQELQTLAAVREAEHADLLAAWEAENRRRPQLVKEA